MRFSFTTLRQSAGRRLTEGGDEYAQAIADALNGYGLGIAADQVDVEVNGWIRIVTVKVPTLNQANIVKTAVEDGDSPSSECSGPVVPCFWKALQDKASEFSEDTIARTNDVPVEITEFEFQPPSAPPAQQAGPLGDTSAKQEVNVVEDGGLSAGAIAGIVIGIVAGVGLILLGVYLKVLKSRYDKANRVMLTASLANGSSSTKIEDVNVDLSGRN